MAGQDYHHPAGGVQVANQSLCGSKVRGPQTEICKSYMEILDKTERYLLFRYLVTTTMEAIFECAETLTCSTGPDNPDKRIIDEVGENLARVGHLMKTLDDLFPFTKPYTHD